jgi:hypothetical protein
MVRNKIIITAFALFIMAMLIVPSTASALSATHSYADNPGTAGSDNSITLNIRNTETQQIYLREVQVTWEWRTLPYEWSGSVGVPTGDTRSVTVNFDVPENVPTTTQTAQVIVYYSIGSASGPTQTDSYTYADFRPESEANMWFYIIIVLIIAVVIIVAAVVYLYVKKKPQVHVYKEIKQVQAEKDDPKTRIRAPAQRPGSSGATQVVGAGGSAATVVTAPGGGLEVLFPKGTKKIVTNEMIIGRQDFEHLIDASLLPRVSKNHLRIYKDGGNFYVEDGYRGKASTNGTKFNGREIRGAGPQQISMPSTISLSDVVDLQLTPNK